MPSLPAGLNGGYYGALPGVPVQPAHSSAPVGLLGPGGPMSSLVGAPGIIALSTCFKWLHLISFWHDIGGPGGLNDRDRERGPSVAHDASTHRMDSASSANSATALQHPDRIKSPPSWRTIDPSTITQWTPSTKLKETLRRACELLYCGRQKPKNNKKFKQNMCQREICHRLFFGGNTFGPFCAL